ncbi:MAG: hypothetical protein H0X24_03850 [Ktedonobacterales bacterium]|nr:hypothetical protein [Ktedonobacterales bacterium]
MEPEDLITPREAAALAGISERAILQWIEQQKLQSWPQMAGQRVRHRVSAGQVHLLAAERRRPPTGAVAYLEQRVAELEALVDDLRHERPHLVPPPRWTPPRVPAKVEDHADRLPPPNTVSVQDYARLHQLSEETVRSAIRDGRIPAIRLRVLYRGHYHTSWIDDAAHQVMYHMWRDHPDFQPCSHCLLLVSRSTDESK